METSTLLSAQQWAEQTFGSVNLGHRSRRERAVTMAAAIAADPAASLPKQMGSEAALHGAYRFLQTPDVSYEQLIQPHVQQTREAMGKPKRVLLIQDPTEVDYQAHPTSTGLGPIGNGTHHGFLLQSVLAVLPQSREVLGLAHQEPFLRQAAPKGETKRERAQRERESQVWERSVQAIGEPAAGVQDLHLDAPQKRPARTAHLALSFGSVRLLPPQSQQASQLRPLVVWVVRVWEPRPPDGVEPVEWVLLTSVPTQTVEQAWERVDWYRARWIVEDYHQGLKTGCRVEQRQVQTYEGLRRLLGLLAPAAVRLLQLRATARQTPEQPASQTLPAEVVQVVAARAGVPASQLTAQQCWHSIARFGGYLGRKGDGPPGWKTLWRGWLYIQTLLEGVHLAAQLSLDSSSDP